MTSRVVILDRLAEEGLTRLKAEPGVELIERIGLTGYDLREALAEADVAICRSGVNIDKAALEGNRRLRAIIRAGVGTDNIDSDAATRCGIIVMNTPAANTISTAEHTMALLLGLARNLVPACESLKQGKWDRKSFVGTQLHGKTLGIVGLGRIGREVASRAIAFGMRVVGLDAYLSHDKARELGIEPVNHLHELLPQVDFLTVHTPLTPETQGLICQETLDRLRPGARLINCARGGIYHEGTLEQGLRTGRIAGVALDVYESEPCTNSPLFQLDGTLCTPHLGASTEEAQAAVSSEAVDLAINFLRTGEIRHAVNAASLDPQTVRGLRGYLDMMFRLGSLLAQWHDGRPARCTVKFRGEISSKDTRLLHAAFCAGFLEHAMDQPANIVNAEVLLAECGIQTAIESSAEPVSFSSSVVATVTTSEGRDFTAAGTIFGNDMPRLIMLNDFRLEAFLDGFLLLFQHRDVPGIIGSVGTILGDARVNIAQMAVGRSGSEQGGPAVGVLNLDSLPDAATLKRVGQVAGVESVRIVKLPAMHQLPRWLPATEAARGSGGTGGIS